MSKPSSSNSVAVRSPSFEISSAALAVNEKMIKSSNKKSRRGVAWYFHSEKKLVDPRGLEPLTSSMSRKRSNQTELRVQDSHSKFSKSISFNTQSHKKKFLMPWKIENQFLAPRQKMGGEGIEPSRPFDQRILSPSCIPFHHSPKNQKGADRN